MTSTVVWVLVLVGSVISAFLYGRRYDAGAVVRDWELLISPTTRRALDLVECEAWTDAARVEGAYARATRARAAGDWKEAERFLNILYSVVEEATPVRTRRLKGLFLCSRMVSAMAPMAALHPHDFRLRELRTLAGISRFADGLLGGARDAFRFRLLVLYWGFRAIPRALRRSLAVITVVPTRDGSWEDCSAAEADFKQLDREHIAVVHQLLLALSAEVR